MLEILLLGVVHQYQWLSPLRFAAYCELAATQRNLYSNWIQQHLQSFSPELIVDEMALTEKDYRFEDTGVPWMYMDIPGNVRSKYGLTSDFRFPGEERIPEIDEPRENYWLCVVEQVAAACKISKILALCGASHVQSFEKKLCEHGHKVSSDDLTKQDWYKGEWCC